MSDDSGVVSVERLIPAEASDIFELLVDPARHPEIDGSGTVRQAKGPAQRLELGSKFGMSMKMGLPYSMVNTVVEFEPDRLIAWRTHGPTALGAHVGGRVWRYELEPTESGTLVRETWDITGETLVLRPLVKTRGDATRKAMASTLKRIEKILTA